jgi:uncharacterized protein YoxC
MNALEIIAVVSLSILGVSLLVLVIALVPILSQALRTLSSLNELLKAVNEQIMPNMVELSNLAGKAGKVVQKGQDIGVKLSDSALALTNGLKASIGAYFGNKNSKKIESSL